MRTIVILEDFTGYPEGSKRQDFEKGQEVEVPDEFAELVIGKGHAEEARGKAKKPAAEQQG